MTILKAEYEGEDRESTLDYLIQNPRDELCLGVFLWDDDLKGCNLKEAHGFIAVDAEIGVGVAGGILPRECLHISVRVSPCAKGHPCRAGLIYADSCETLTSSRAEGA